MLGMRLLNLKVILRQWTAGKHLPSSVRAYRELVRGQRRSRLRGGALWWNVDDRASDVIHPNSGSLSIVKTFLSQLTGLLAQSVKDKQPDWKQGEEDGHKKNKGQCLLPKTESAHLHIAAKNNHAFL